MSRKPAKRGEPRRYLIEVVLPFVGDECLPWPYSHNSSGYANISDPRGWRSSVLVSRLICEHNEGPAPSDKPQAAHRCGNEWCVNPKHIRWASALENSQDKVLHGTLKPSSFRVERVDGKVVYRGYKRGPGHPKHVPSRKIFGSPQWIIANSMLAAVAGTLCQVLPDELVRPLPDRSGAPEKAAYAFIIDFIRRYGFPPSYPEICQAIGMETPSGVHRVVHSLASMGLIELAGHGQRRGIRLIPPSPCSAEAVRAA